MATEPAAIDKVREAMSRGDTIGALRICSKFPHLGANTDVIQLAWSAYKSPALYRDIGVDVDAAIIAAEAAIRQRIAQ